MIHDTALEDSFASSSPAAMRAKALCAAGRMAYFESDFAAARANLEEGLALFRQSGDQFGVISAMSSLLLVSSWQGETAAALSLFQEGMAILRQMPDRTRLLPVLTNFGWATLFLSAPEILSDARTLNEEVVRLARAAGDKRSLGIALDCLGQCFYWTDQLAPARRVYEECLPLLRYIGENLMADHAIWGLGKVALREGRLEEARACAARSLFFQKQHKSPIGVPYIIESFAHLAVVEAQPQRAVRLFAAAARLREEQRSFPQPLVVAENEQYLTPLRETLSAEDFATAWAQGDALTMEEAITYALENEMPDPAQTPEIPS